MVEVRDGGNGYKLIRCYNTARTVNLSKLLWFKSFFFQFVKIETEKSLGSEEAIENNWRRVLKMEKNPAFEWRRPRFEFLFHLSIIVIIKYVGV